MSTYISVESFQELSQYIQPAPMPEPSTVLVNGLEFHRYENLPDISEDSLPNELQSLKGTNEAGETTYLARRTSHKKDYNCYCCGGVISKGTGHSLVFVYTTDRFNHHHIHDMSCTDQFAQGLRDVRPVEAFETLPSTLRYHFSQYIKRASGMALDHAGVELSTT